MREILPRVVPFSCTPNSSAATVCATTTDRIKRVAAFCQDTVLARAAGVGGKGAVLAGPPGAPGGP